MESQFAALKAVDTPPAGVAIVTRNKLAGDVELLKLAVGDANTLAARKRAALLGEDQLDPSGGPSVTPALTLA